MGSDDDGAEGGGDGGGAAAPPHAAADVAAPAAFLEADVAESPRQDIADRPDAEKSLEACTKCHLIKTHEQVRVCVRVHLCARVAFAACVIERACSRAIAVRMRARASRIVRMFLFCVEDECVGVCVCVEGCAREYRLCLFMRCACARLSERCMSSAWACARVVCLCARGGFNSCGRPCSLRTRGATIASGSPRGRRTLRGAHAGGRPRRACLSHVQCAAAYPAA
jgi:hypothetical protein